MTRADLYLPGLDDFSLDAMEACCRQLADEGCLLHELRMAAQGVGLLLEVAERYSLLDRWVMLETWQAEARLEDAMEAVRPKRGNGVR